LATTLLVDPVPARDHVSALDRAVAGHTPDAIGSGTGTVGNAFQLREPQKTVLSYAFRPRIKPLTSVTNRTAGTTLRRALAYWTTADLRHLPAATASAIRG
jgi:hypothetical protein